MKLKKFLVMVLSMAIVLGTTSFAVFAEGVTVDNNYQSPKTKVEVNISETPVHEVATKAELEVAIATAEDKDTILLIADIDYTGTASLEINKPITLDLNEKTLTTNGTYGGLRLMGNCSLKNGTLAHKGTVSAIKAWNVETIENVVIDVAFKEEGKTIGGIVIQNVATNRIETIKNVTIKGEGLTNGIETYNCGDATEDVIGLMENLTIDAKGVGMLISAPLGTATNCNVKGGTTGIELWIKGTYSAKLALVDCDVEGGTQALYVHDELTSNPDAVNSGELKLTADADTIFTSQSGKPLTYTIKRAENVELGETIQKLRSLEGSGTEEEPFLINNIDELKWFRDDVNSGNNYNGKFITLTTDINLENEDWTPIGTGTNTFNGNFDGNSKTISNLVINGDKTYVSGGNNDNYKGLFGYSKGNGTVIKNVNIYNAKVTGCLYVGALIGRVYTGATIRNCHISGDIAIDSYAYAGGLAGRYEYASGIYNCSVKDTTDDRGTVNADYAVSYVGGLVGFTTEPNPVVTIDGCSVENINVSGVYGVGGLAGIAHQGVVISNASVSKVTVKSEQTGYTDEKRSGNVGLIAGACMGTQTNPTVFTNITVTETTGTVTDTEGTVTAVTNLYGNTMNGTAPVTNYVAKIRDVEYETLQKAFDAVESNQTIELLAGEISEGTVKFPPTLTNVTIKGAADKATVLRDMEIHSADGNSIVYEGIVIDGIVFENSNIVMTGWRTGEVSYKDWTIANCEFKDIVNTSNNAAVHFNLAQTEALKDFTFTNNVIDGVSGSSNSGVYVAATGEIIFTNNVINNLAFRPILLQINDTDGVADDIILTGNTFSGSAKGRLQVYGTEITLEDGSYVATGTDTINMTVSKNIFKDITGTYYICCWGINPTYSTVDLGKNYYDIPVEESYNKFYWNNEIPTSVEELAEIGVTSVYTNLNEDGTIDTQSLVYITVAPTEILKNSLFVTYTELGKFDFGNGETNSIKLSLFAGVDNLNYSEVGFDVTIGEETQNFPVNIVYSSVKTILNGEVTTIEASEFGNGVNYIFGQTINFPATDVFKNAAVIWTPYAIKNKEKITGNTFTLEDVFPGELGVDE